MYGIAGIIAVCVFFTELLVKSYLRSHFPGASLPVIKNILHITVVFNQGAAFGILQGYNAILIYIGMLLLLVFSILAYREKHQKSPLFYASWGLIVGGALSNLYDRIFFGFVIDYIDIRVWPVFNLSDMCISIGAGLLLIQSFRHKSVISKAT